MDLNGIFNLVTDLYGDISFSLGIRPYIRHLKDLRLVLYHGIGDGNDPCFRYLFDEIPEKIFARHVQYLIKNYEILSLNEAITRILNEEKIHKKPICSITFDDGLRSVYLKAFPILKELKVPATVFVNTSVVGNKSMTFLHLINYLLVKFGVNKVCAVINELKNSRLPVAPNDAIKIQEWYVRNYEVNIRDMLLEKILTWFGLTVEKVALCEKIYLSWEQIEEMQKSGFDFCSHTDRHAPLAFIEDALVSLEISKSYEVLKQKKQNLSYVSFPFGMDYYYGQKAVEYARKIGHEYIVEVGNGANNYDKLKIEKRLSRASLGLINDNSSRLYSAIEIRPLLKDKIKSSLKKHFSKR